MSARRVSTDVNLTLVSSCVFWTYFSLVARSTVTAGLSFSRLRQFRRGRQGPSPPLLGVVPDFHLPPLLRHTPVVVSGPNTASVTRSPRYS